MASTSDNTLEAGGRWINLFLLEDLSFSSSSTDPSIVTMESIVWNRMPQELVEEVLLFLPASSQARFHTVCKRWRQLMTFPEFRQKTTSIAFSRGVYPCILRLGRSTPHPIQHYGELEAHTGDAAAEAIAHDRARRGDAHNRARRGDARDRARRGDAHDRAIGRWCKWRRVKIPGLVLPRGTKKKLKLFTGSSVPLVGVVCVDVNATALHLRMRCWVLHIAGQTFKKLPPLDLVRTHVDLDLDRNIWLVGTSSTDFQVLMVSEDAMFWPAERPGHRLHTYSSSEGSWRTVRLVLLLDPNAPMLPGRSYNSLAHSMQTVLAGRYNITVPTSHMPGWPGLYGASLLSDSGSQSEDVDVFALGSTPPGIDIMGDARYHGGLFLYKVKWLQDESGYCSTCRSDSSACCYVWERLFSQMQPPVIMRLGLGDMPADDVTVLVKVLKGQIVGPLLLVLLQARVWTFANDLNKEVKYKDYCWAMAYNLLDGACQWQRIHPYVGLQLGSQRNRMVCMPARPYLFVSPLISIS